MPALSFTSFVISIASSAAIHFGDLPDPNTGHRAPLNLEGASQMIDILALIQIKTKGNLTAEERSLLDQLLDELHERFDQASGDRKMIVEP